MLAIEIAISGLNQCGKGRSTVVSVTERMQRGQRAVETHSEHGAAIVCRPGRGCAIKVAIGSLYQCSFGNRAIVSAGERPQSGQRTVGGDSENRAVTVGAAGIGRAIE